MLKRREGFSLVEMAIVLVIIGLLAGGGMSMLRSLTQRKARTETLDYINAAKEAVVNYAMVQGRFPWADTNSDGKENSGKGAGFLPYADTTVRPNDPFRRQLTYAVNPLLAVDRNTTCKALRTGLSGAPLVVDADGATAASPVAFVIISAGPMDADGDGKPFDKVTKGTHKGDNTDGKPNYLRYPPVTAFDDLTIYVGGAELYRTVCGDPVLSVNNKSASPVYMYDTDTKKDLATIDAGDIHSQRIFAGTTVELRSAPSGGGSVVSSTPSTPAVLSGNGISITIP